jgi:hypothetical protein
MLWWCPGWESNSLPLLSLRKLLILRYAGVATTAKFARVGYSLGITQSVLLRGAAQLTNHSSRFLAERSADFVADTTPHNRDVFLGPSTPIERRVMLSLDGNEKLQRHHRQRRVNL